MDSARRLIFREDSLDAGADLAPAVEALRRGGIVAHPTETVYGLAVDPWNAAAVERLVALKGRQGKAGLIVIAASREEAKRLGSSGRRETLDALTRAFWPGPLTLILRPSDSAPRPAVGAGGGIAVRWTSDPAASALVRAAGHALISTSANMTGQPAATTAAEVLASLGGRVDVVIDGGARGSIVPSTLLDLTGERVLLVREGAVPCERITAVIGPLDPV